jgi:hypothetical protein
MSQITHIAKNQAKHAGGRPRVYDRQKVWAELLRLIGEDGESLAGALRRMPARQMSLSMAKQMLADDPALRARYEAAVLDRADVLGERLITLADAPLPQGLAGPELIAAVNMRRLQIDVRKFVAAKLSPRKWSERMQVDVDVTQRISVLDALAQAERRVHTLATDPVIEDARVIETNSQTHRAVARRKALTCSGAGSEANPGVSPSPTDAASVPK